MSDAIKLAIDTLQNTIDCLMRENENTAEEAHQAYLKAKRQVHEGCTI